MEKLRPPLPPSTGTREDENYQVDPKVAPAMPKQGDVQTGQPLGPAFAQMPRDAQRGAVNSTFNELVDNARQAKGSVFDTWFDKALRTGASDPSGGFGPSSIGGLGVVANEAHPVFQRLLMQYPRFAGALQKMKPVTQYFTKPASQVSEGRALGNTTTLAEPEAAAILHELGMLKGAKGFSADELGTLANRSLDAPGASYQVFPRAPRADTAIHEGYHSIYAGKNPLTQDAGLADDRAFELMQRVLQRAKASPQDVQHLNTLYALDPNYGLIEALGRYQVAKRGAMNVR